MEKVKLPRDQQHYESLWQDYMPKQIAWGTIALAVGVLSGYLIVIPAAMQGFIPYWVASILCGYLAFASFTVGHDAGHGAIIRSGSRWKRLETVLGWLSTVPLLATSYKLFQKIHDRHHSFTNDPDRDPDYMPGDKGIVQLILGLGIIPFRYNWLAVTRFKKDKAMRDTYLPTLVFFSLVWGTLLALAIMDYATEVVFFSLIPLAIANFLLLTFFDYIPHYPHKSQDVYQATRIYPGKLLNVLLFGQNYHLIHHMYPKLPWYRYKAVYERLEPYLKQQDAAIDHIEQGEKLYSSSNGVELTDGATKLHWNAHVKTVNRLTKDAVEIEFDIPKGWLHYRAGQYLTVSKWLNGAYHTRCYSLCVSPSTHQLKIAVKKVSGGLMSSYLTEQLQVGDQLTIKGPYGDFIYPSTSTEQHSLLLVAAGSGITPIRSILEYALQHEPNTPIALIYANREFKDIIFYEPLIALEKQYSTQLKITWVLEQPDERQPAHTGRVDTDVLNHTLNTLSDVNAKRNANPQVYICGPEPMKNAVLAELEDLNIPSKRVFVEEFVSKGVEPEGPLHSIEITLADGQQHHIQVASNQTVLSIAQQQRLDMPFACGTGLCGSCKFKVIDGQSEAFSAPGISDTEVSEGYTLACQCKPTSTMRLVEPN